MKTMIGYFLKAGDSDVSDMFTPYVWGQYGIAARLEKDLCQEYGPDLKLLLIQYYVEGKFSINAPDKPKVNNYSTKDKDISVAIPVSPELFHLRNELERREFIVDSSLNAIQMVKERFIKRTLQFDFATLIKDFNSLAQEYIKHPDLLLPTPTNLQQ